MDEIKTNMDIGLLIAECTAYDFKVILEESRPKSWLKSVSAFANTMGGSLFFGVDNDGSVKGLESYKDDRRSVFKSSPSQFMTIIYSVDYTVTGKDTGNVTKQSLSWDQVVTK